MTNLQKLLAVGGVTALLAGYAVMQGDKESDIQQSQDIKAGEEIVAKRTEYMKVYKGEGRQYEARLYTKQQHYYDTTDESYKEIDLSVKDITASAEKEPERTHDQYVDPGTGLPKTRWFKEKPYDYTFINPDGYYVTYKSLHDTTDVLTELRFNANETKEIITIADGGATVLSWQLITNTVHELAGQRVVYSDLADNELFETSAPWARDAKGVDIPIVVSVNEDTLKYALKTTVKTVYPIVVDPTSKSLTYDDADATTGYLIKQGSSYATIHDAADAGSASNTAISVSNRYSDPTYTIERGVLRFSTSVLQDFVTLDSAKIRLELTSKSVTDDFFVKFVCMKDSVNTGYLNTGHYDEFEGNDGGSSAYDVTIASDSLDVETYSVNDTLTFTLTSSGLSDVTKTGVSQFMLLAGDDIARVQPSGNDGCGFDDDNPYIHVYYTVPEDYIFAVLDGGVAAISGRYTDGANTGARDTTAGTTTNSNTWYVGQKAVDDTQYWGMRAFGKFPVMSNVLTVNEATLKVYLEHDYSTVDFVIQCIPGSTLTGALTVNDYNQFYGWRDTGGYDPANYLATGINTSGISSGYNNFVFSEAGKDSIKDASGDSLRLVLISWNDINNSAPDSATNEYVYFYGSSVSGKEPYLSMDVDYIIPTSFDMAVNDADSIDVSWACTYDGEDGLIVVNWADSTAVSDTLAADATSTTIGGLIPNTEYVWMVMIVDYDEQYYGVSAPDSAYTLPELPSLTVYQTADSTIKVHIDTTGTSNPSTTQYALQDSSSELYIYPVSGGLDTLGRSASWFTLATQQTDADTAEIYLRYSTQDGDPDSSIIGHTMGIRIKGKTDG